MGIITKLAVGTALVAAGYYIGHYMVPPQETTYEPVQKQGIEKIVNNKTKAEYIKSDLPNVVRYLGKQDQAKLEEALKNK